MLKEINIACGEELNFAENRRFHWNYGGFSELRRKNEGKTVLLRILETEDEEKETFSEDWRLIFIGGN